MQVVLSIVAIFTILGAWRGWRRSPLYSVRITLKLIGSFLLILAAIVGVSMAISNGPVSRSPRAQATLGIAAFLALTTGAMVLLIRITDAHVARLPPAVRLVSLYRRKVQRWITRTIVFLLIAAGAAQLLPSSWSWLPLSLGGFVLLLCGPMLAIFYMMARRNDRGMSAVIATPWVHWQYTPAQWQSWANDQLEWERSQVGTSKSNRRGMLILLLVCALLFVFGAWFSGGSVRENVVVIAVLMAVVTLAVLCAGWFNRTSCERRYRRLLVAVPEAYFGAEGLFCNGEYAPWTLSGSYLVEATAPRDPPARLVFIFQTFNGGSFLRVPKRIPIPEGRESDLAPLQQRLQACCRTASVHLITPAV